MSIRLLLAQTGFMGAGLIGVSTRSQNLAPPVNKALIADLTGEFRLGFAGHSGA